ncbi:uncharacterized protein LOC143913375 [Arctopsyche grandis]|uniref:uncharacterized protein LOC143913375 n=1 Tax=Arctopsyche grandis TaxID=121162 RepID=UPI00406D78B5
MKQTILTFVLLVLHSFNVLASGENVEIGQISEAEKKLANQILKILEHYKQEDPVGVPGAEIPDPMPIPKMKHSFPAATMTFNDVNVYGLSKFRIMYVKSEISAMEVNAALKIKNLQVIGNYTMSTWISRSQGPFVVNLTDVYVQGLANLAIERDGRLQAQDINMDITFSNIAMKFDNLGFMGSIFQGILNSVGTFLFESIKPFVLKEAYTKIRDEVNKNLENLAGEMRFPNSLSPLDMVIADTRTKVRQMNLDPMLIPDYNHVTPFYRADLSHTWVTGISSFYRMGNISLSVENHTLIADFEIGTQKLEGKTHWDLSFVGGLVSRAGTASFSVDYFTVRVVLAQPLDTRKHPQCRDLQLELGNIQARCDGAGTIDYVIEFVVNILPNLLRYQIMDAIEGPIMEKVQEKFDTIEVETIIKSNLLNMKNIQMPDLPIAQFRRPEPPPEEVVEDDEFWKFD